MANLTTSYLGLTLNSPLIVSSSRLTSTIDQLKEAEENGAGAVVLKTLFEEQIIYDMTTLPSSDDYPEANDYLSHYTKSYSVDEYTKLIKDAKRELRIPVIPSINCFSLKGWTSFAKNIVDAGADAIEINVFFMPNDRKRSSGESERIYFDLIEKLKATVSVPIALKIGSSFSNVLYMIDQFYDRGVNGVVMFNRFYESDIDTEKQEIIPSTIFSSAGERRNVLRWVALASAQNINIDISASTGVQSGEDAVRYLLAGADSVQVCSVLYREGMSFLKTMNKQIIEWMTDNNFENIADFRGKLNRANYKDPDVFERTQYMKYYSSLD